MQPVVNGMFETPLEDEIRNSINPIQCGICGENHSPKECNILSVTNHIPDKVIPSKARLSLPDSFEIKTLADCSFSIYAHCLIQKGTQFGPFQAKKLCTLYPSINFPLKIFTNNEEDLSEYFLDTSDENECSWMVFIGSACDFEEQNLICYQEGEHLFYATIRDINPGEALKVWYSPHYALKMKKEVLNDDMNEETVRESQPVDINALLKNKKNIMPRDLWSCKFCGKVEKELSVFAIHLLDHYRSQLRRICDICKDTFSSRQLLKKHLKIVHGNISKQNTDIVNENQISVLKVNVNTEQRETSVGGPLLLNDITPDSLDNSSLILPQTVMSQFNLDGIENHSNLLENENLNLNVDNILTENVKELDHFNFEINEPETEQLICDICLKNFFKLKYLIQHIEQHTGKFFCYECNRVFARKENLKFHHCKSYYRIKCQLCDRIFFQKKYLTQHIKNTHNKSFTCEHCHTFFDSKSNLDTHNCPNVPLNQKEKFPCSICSKIFFRKRNLDAHLKRHTMKNPSQEFICAVCNRILNSRKTYLKHINLHDDQRYPCDMCNKTFRRKDILKTHKEEFHIKKQAMETCNICKKKIKSKKLLKTHMEIHQIDKMYKCHICQSKFKQQTNLTKHVKNHKSSVNKFESLFQKEGIQMYFCPKCDKKFKLKSSLSRHMKTFHPDHVFPSYNTIKPKLAKLNKDKDICFLTDTREDIEAENTIDEDSVMDLKQTIENMNFNTDEINTCSENNDINMEIDKILNNPDNFLSESNDRLVETLVNNISAKENSLKTEITRYEPKEVCLSMPDLTDADQEIKLGDNAYILDNGTIVEPQEHSSKVVVYILGQDKFP